MKVAISQSTPGNFDPLSNLPTNQRNDHSGHYHQKHSFLKHKKVFIALIATMTTLLLTYLVVFMSNRDESTSDQTQAAVPSAQYASEFQEVTTALTKPTSYVDTDHYNPITRQPSKVTISGRTFTFKGKSAAIFDNPLKNESFYRISVTLTDTNTESVVAYLSGLGELWSKGRITTGISVGVNGLSNKYAYHFDTSDHIKGYNKLSSDKKKWTDQYWSKFIKRYPHDVQLDLYVTPIGTYAVIDKYNTFTFPNDYAGRPVLKPGPINYIVIGKWDENTNTAMTFKNLEVTKLDSVVANVDEVNAYFIKKAFKEAYPIALQDRQKNTLSSNDALWMAFLARGYDFYFGTPGAHQADVRAFADYALRTARDNLQKKISLGLARYDVKTFAKNSVKNDCLKKRPNGWTTQNYGTMCDHLGTRSVDINHDFMNKLSSTTMVLFAISDYLDTTTKEKYRQALAPVIDKTIDYIFPNNDPEYAMFEGGNWYEGDTAMEEYGWLMTFYAGYYGLYYYDNDSTTSRSSKILEYLVFLDHHGYSEKPQSVLSAFGQEMKWDYLPPIAKNFTTQTVWPTGEIDNHDFHPSVNYGNTAASDYTRLIINRVAGIHLPSVRINQKEMYDSYKDHLDVTTLRRREGTVKRLRDPEDTPHTELRLEDTTSIDTATWRFGLVTDYYGFGTPSLLEDGSVSFYGYHIPLAQSDYEFAMTMARNVYFALYNSTGNLACHQNLTDYVSCLTIAPYAYNYYGPLFAMVFHPTSQFSVWKQGGRNVDQSTKDVTSNNDPSSWAFMLSASNNNGKTADSIEVTPTGTVFLKTDVALSGQTEVAINNKKTKIITFTNGNATIPVSQLGSETRYELKVRPVLDAKYSGFKIDPKIGYAWSSPVVVNITEIPAIEKKYTQQLYRELTGSTPSQTDTAFSQNVHRVLNNNCLGAVNNITTLPEFQRRKATYQNAQYISMLYRTILSIDPEKAGIEGWTKRLTENTTTRDAMITEIYASQEAKIACRERKFIEPATSQPTPSNTPSPTPSFSPTPTPQVSPPLSKEQQFTQQLYRELTGSTPSLTDTGFKTNLSLVTANKCLIAVNNIATLNSFIERKKSYADEAYVKMLYRAILSRNPDPNGSTSWVNALENRSQTRDSIITAFYDFDEARVRCADKNLISQ